MSVVGALPGSWALTASPRTLSTPKILEVESQQCRAADGQVGGSGGGQPEAWRLPGFQEN